jgi:hypothetical protein
MYASCMQLENLTDYAMKRGLNFALIVEALRSGVNTP